MPARPDIETGFKRKSQRRGRGHGAAFPPERTITFAECRGNAAGARTSDEQISLLGARQLAGQSVLGRCAAVSMSSPRPRVLGREITD
jgi:hypothetical protein